MKAEKIIPTSIMGESPEVTKEFLERTLKRPVVDFIVTEGSNKGDNYMGVMVAVEVTTLDNNGQKRKEHIIIKCYPLHPTRQEFANAENVFYNELKVYEKWFPALIALKNRYMPNTPALPFPPFINGEAIDFKAIGKE